MNYSVIIAERNEPDLKNTVTNIKHNNNAHVIVQSDNKGLGPQAMRDRGIGLAAGSDVVIVMDGHMRTQKGTLDAMAEWVHANPTSVAVAQCHHSYTEDWTGQPYSGASFAWKDQGKDANEPQAFTAKWRKDHATGQIPCVMGACYAFSRAWYMDGLRRPWQYGTGWGCDEELISAATWLMGGRVDLLPVSVWHQARKPGQVPYKITNQQLIGVWANRTRILDMLPMSADERNELVKHIMPALTLSQWRQVNAVSNQQEVAEYNSFLSTGPMDWATFKQEYIGVQTIKPTTMKELREQARNMGITVPFGCKKVELQALIGGKKCSQPAKNRSSICTTTRVIAPKEVKTLANWGAAEINSLGKRACVHCGGGVTVVVTTMRAGSLLTRYRKCNDCTKRFPTREIVATP